MIVLGVASTVFIVLIAIGLIAHISDGVSAVKRRPRRKERAAAVYGAPTSSPERR
jgi:hypothetical protein